MFTVTPEAAKQIEMAVQNSDAEGMALRIAAKRQADGSVEYGMGFDEIADEDMKLDLNGIPVVIGPEYQQILDATILDFVELNPGEFNFIFSEQMEAPTGGGCGTKSSDGGCGSGGCSTGGCGSSNTMH
jgi:iron-sulfur cluster assembly protein